MLRLHNFNRVNLVLLLIGALSIILSLTKFYGISYLLCITVLSVCLPSIRVFSSMVSRFILSLLLLLSVSMIIGMFTLLIHMQLYPVLVTLALLVLASVCGRSTQFSYPQVKFVTKIDVLSIVLALIAPVIIYLSFFAPKYNDSTLYQFLSNGWDNSSHIVMLESTGLHNSYTYNLQSNDNNLDGFGAGYPQGWHLATSNFINGFGDWLNINNPIVVMRSYTLALFGWFIISAYLITVIGYGIFNRDSNRVTTTELIALALSSLLLQSVTVLGSLLLGFANFIGLIVYMLISIALIVSYEKRKNHKITLILLTLATVASILCWFLPLPALLATLLLFVIYTYKSNAENFLSFIKRNKLTLLFIIILTSVAVLQQLYTYLSSTVIGGAAQLNVAGGVYKNSTILIGLFIIVAAIYAKKSLSRNLFNAFLYIVLPMIIIVGSLYIYQYVTIGKLSYYYYKLLIILSLVVGIFFVAAITKHSRVLNDYISSPVLRGASVLGIFLMIIVSSIQSYPNESYLLQRNSVVTTSVSDKIVSYLNRGDFKRNKLVVFTDNRSEGYNGELYTLVTYTPITCSHQIVNIADGKSASIKPKDVIDRINDCSRLDNLNIEIVTDIDDVQALVGRTHNNNLHVSEVNE